MTQYEYKVVPAPAKGEKARGLKGAESRFAYAVERLMNEMAAGGWEYQRAETLPSEERSGLTSSQTVWRNLLVFRRPRDTDASDDTLEGRRLASAAELAGSDDFPEEPDTLPETEETPSEPEDDPSRPRFSTRQDNDDEGSETPPLEKPGSILTDRAQRLRQNSAAE